jgi:hypothetical protein
VAGGCSVGAIALGGNEGGVLLINRAISISIFMLPPVILR